MLLAAEPPPVDLTRLTPTERLQSLSGARLPGFFRVQAEVCRGDGVARARYLEGLARALAVPGAPLAPAYQEIVGGCRFGPPCSWLREELGRWGPRVDTFLWREVASCHPLDAPGLFDGSGAPDAAVVAYHARRPIGRFHSRRLAEIVAARYRLGDPEPLRDALAVYGRMVHEETAAHLLDLASRPAEDEIQWGVVKALRHQSDPSVRERFFVACRERQRASVERWRARGAHPRASPLRWGDDCAPGGRWIDRPRAAAERGPPVPEHAGGFPVWHVPGLQFEDASRLLWEMAAALAPDLDEVVFRDVWPAVDRVPLHRGPARFHGFINGDAIAVELPLRDGKPDLGAWAALEAELLAALPRPRRIDVSWRGETRSSAYEPSREAYDLDRFVEIANRTLARVGSARRIERAPEPGWLRVTRASRRLSDTLATWKPPGDPPASRAPASSRSPSWPPASRACSRTRWGVSGSSARSGTCFARVPGTATS